jgi:hypothetical protein
LALDTLARVVFQLLHVVGKNKMAAVVTQTEDDGHFSLGEAPKFKDF